MSKAIITGGSGYVGSHLIDLLIQKMAYDSILILDLVPPSVNYADEPVIIEYLECDLRNEADAEQIRSMGFGDTSVIYNLAAICRIPGFPDIDYYRTNICEAETTCQLAEELGIDTVVFTSSVSPYGKSEELKTEQSVPQPDDPYGGSKLVAEYIHRGWQEKDQKYRSLSILRPGIIFGKGEQANFTRLYDSQKKGYFVYPGRKDTKKACIYVKDVARACLHFSRKKSGIHLYNLVYEDAPTIEEICLTVAEHTDAKKPLLKIPGPLLIFVAYCIMGLGKITNWDFKGIHPDRVKKVMMSTNVSGKALAGSDFELSYSLSDGIKEWFIECNGKLA